MALQAGAILRDRYKVLRPIGQGGMGSVYLAEDIRLSGRQCALKEIIGDPNMTPEALQQARVQFHREASVLARLDHPNLPKVSDFFSYGDTDVLVMDYVAGQNLKSIMETARTQGRFIPQPDILEWTRQIADALLYLHGQENPVVHRDIKPSNLKLTPSGLIKLVDFGLVKLMAPDERTVTVVQGRGSVYYTPLEQYGGDTGHTDVRADIYSLAATVYHLSTNEPPPEAKVRFLSADSLIPMRDINPRITARTERAVIWALSLHPDERPTHISQFTQALFDGVFPAEDGTPVFVPETSGEWIREALADPTQRYMAIAAGALMLLAVIATLAGAR
ncbi:MAG: serine/threonine protein kinase [Anaerolineales bacterium]